MPLVDGSMGDAEIVQILEDLAKNESFASRQPDLGPAEKKALWETLESFLSDPKRSSRCGASALKILKILSRDRNLVEAATSRNTIEILLRTAGIVSKGCHSVRQDVQGRDFEAIAESLKCLSNICLLTTKAHGYCLDNELLAGVTDQFSNYERLEIPLEAISFDARVLFLVTAYSTEARRLAVVEHDALGSLLGVVREIVRRSATRRPQPVLDQTEVQAINDVLKVLFNCTLADDLDEATTRSLGDAALCVHTLVTVEKEDPQLERSVVGNCINLLTNFPISSLENTLLPLSRELVAEADRKEVMYDGCCVNVPKAFLEHLMFNLKNTSQGQEVASLRELSTPDLNVLCALSAGHAAVRRYFKSTVLPPLKDVSARPEVGSSDRNVLCRFLTSPETSVSIMVAEFLFILCKENVNRLVKYTGYGNAAGLLARRGLLAGCSGRGVNAPGYSDSEYDSESDTEEYAQNAHKVNPVTGCEEQPHPSPFEGMTEEQKEHEAVKLANLIDRLHGMGVIKPAKMGKDGRPAAVDHVLELLDNTQDEDSDVD